MYSAYDLKKKYLYISRDEQLYSSEAVDIYKGYDSNLLQEVIIKIFKQPQLYSGHLLSHLQNLTRASHRNLIRYYDVFEIVHGSASTKMVVAVMEYGNAGNLRTYLQEEGQSKLLPILKDVLTGLDSLHQNELIHYNLKPENVLLAHTNDQLTAKLGDFGLENLRSQSGQTSINFVSSVEYKAPEQFNVERFGADNRIQPNVDLWAFGVMLYEALTGKLPFGSRERGDSTGEIIHRIMSEHWDSGAESTIAPQYRYVLDLCLQKSAQQRIQHAYELLPMLSASGSQAKPVIKQEVREPTPPKVKKEEVVQEPEQQEVVQPVPTPEPKAEEKPKPKPKASPVIPSNIDQKVKPNKRSRKKRSWAPVLLVLLLLLVATPFVLKYWGLLNGPSPQQMMESSNEQPVEATEYIPVKTGNVKQVRDNRLVKLGERSKVPTMEESVVADTEEAPSTTTYTTSNNNYITPAPGTDEVTEVSVPTVQPTSSTDNFVWHYVEPESTLNSLAQQYGTSVSQLKAWNGLSSDNVPSGFYLIVGIK